MCIRDSTCAFHRASTHSFSPLPFPQERPGKRSRDGSGGDDDDDDSNSDGAPSRPPQDRGRAGMTREEQRLHKIAVKLAKRERRKTKTPKAVKKAHAKAR